MPRDPVKQKIIKALREEFSSPRDRIVIREGFEELLHLYIVSHKFKGKRLREKGELITSILLRSLAEEEWGRISLAVGLSPEEAKKYWPPMPELNSR